MDLKKSCVKVFDSSKLEILNYCIPVCFNSFNFVLVVQYCCYGLTKSWQSTTGNGIVASGKEARSLVRPPRSSRHSGRGWRLPGHGLGGNYLPISQLFSLEARQDLAVMQPVRNLQSILHNPPITN